MFWPCRYNHGVIWSKLTFEAEESHPGMAIDHESFEGFFSEPIIDLL
jgi:hypothetical protein